METNSNVIPPRQQFLIGQLQSDWNAEKKNILSEYTEYVNSIDRSRGKYHKNYNLYDYYIVVFSDLFGTTLYLN